MPTITYQIGPADGWVEVASSPKFVRTSGVPHSHPYNVYAGSSAPSTNPTSGTGTVVFATGVPVADETVTIGTEVYTFKALAALPFEVTIAATNLLTAVNFAAAVNLYSTIVTANNVAGTVTLTSYIEGTAGNYALAESATNVSVSGATLTGGAALKQGVLVCHHPFEVNVTMAEKLFVRVRNPVASNPANDGTLRVDVFTIA